jgi:hypothetical protein
MGKEKTDYKKDNTRISAKSSFNTANVFKKMCQNRAKLPQALAR